ncbi:MAG: adenylate/guanylate cyclase domain-containing protein [Acidobacteriota bacterium]
MSILETLGSYVPSLIIRRVNANPTQFTTPIAEKFYSVVLFADVSGFTALTERLASRGPAGAEDLAHMLNNYFGQLIDLITGYGGDIVKFAGDALLSLWPISATNQDPVILARQVAQCSLAIQQRLNAYQVAQDITLSLKLAVGAGDLLAETLGGVFGRWEFLIAGPPLSQVGNANSQTQPGEVVISPEAWALLREHCTGEAKEDGYIRLTAMREWYDWQPNTYPVPLAHAANTLRSFIPGAIRTRLDAGQTDWLAELRRVTVLFVNLPEFNYQTPVELAQEAMSTLQTCLYRYEGSINKISVDDKGTSLVAALGLPPLSHEDDPVRGVRAALAMQEALEKMGLQSAIGVTTGLVFCGSVGSTRRREYTLMGDVVNLAARLMQAAPGDILCDSTTAQAAKGRLIFNELPPLKVKGKKEPVAVYRPAINSTPVHTKTLKPDSYAEMIGRTKEQTLLAEKLNLLLEKQQSSRIIIEGEAGIGKSRLTEALIKHAQERGASILTGAGDSIESNTPYHAWRSVFTQLFNLDELPNSPALRQTQVLQHLPSDEKVLRLVPLLNVVLPYWLDNEFTLQMTGKLRADSTHDLLTSLLQEAANRAPLLLVIEDAHWLDSGSLALLLMISQRVNPLLLVVVTRPMPEPLPSDFQQLVKVAGTERIVLENLTPDEALELVCKRLGVASLPLSVSEIIREKAEGNPFFSEELAYSMRDSGLILIKDGQCQIAHSVGATPSWHFPDTIQGVITSRIDRLTASEQLTMKVASVIGRVFSYRTLYDVHPISDDKTRIPSHFEVLQNLDLTPLERPAPDLAYIFKHIITRDVAYNLMLFAQRRQLHRAVAEWYEHTYTDSIAQYYPLLAFHWRKAVEDHNPDPELRWKAIDYLQKAGEQAEHSYVQEEAIGFFKEALELLAKLPDTIVRAERELQLQLALGAPLIATRGYGASEVAATYSRARELCYQVGDNNKLFPALRGLWAFHIGRADYQEAQVLGKQMLKLAQEEQNRAILMEAHRALGNSMFWIGDLTAAQQHMQEGITLYVADQDRTLAFLYGQDPDVANRGMQAWPLSLQGYPEQALKRGEEAIEHAQQLSHPYSLGYALVHDMCCHQYLYQVELAQQRAEAAMALASEKGFPNWLLAAMAIHGWTLSQQGRTSEGIAQLQQVIDLWRSTGSELVIPYFLTMLAEAYGKNGQYQKALEVIDDAISVAEKNNEQWYSAETYRLQGELLEAVGKEAEPAYQQAIEIARKQGAHWLELRATTSLSRLWQKQGKTQEAHKVLTSVYDWFKEGFELKALTDAKLLLQELA